MYEKGEYQTMIHSEVEVVTVDPESPPQFTKGSYNSDCDSSENSDYESTSFVVETTEISPLQCTELNSHHQNTENDVSRDSQYQMGKEYMINNETRENNTCQDYESISLTQEEFVKVEVFVNNYEIWDLPKVETILTVKGEEETQSYSLREQDNSSEEDLQRQNERNSKDITAKHSGNSADSELSQIFSRSKSKLQINNDIVKTSKIDDNVRAATPVIKIRDDYKRKKFTELCSKQESKRKSKKPENDRELFNCRDCGRNFRLKRSLFQHLLVHNKPESDSYQCCVTEHLESHIGNLSHDCPFCSKRFKTEDDLVHHMKKIHTNKNKPRSCKYCGKKVKNLKLHERTHTYDKPYICRICEKTFLYKSTFHDHEKTHLKLKPFSCRFCNNSYAYRITLKNHERTHTNEKPYKCGECKVRFYARVQLSKHSKIHSPDRPFECDVCHSAFKQKSYLINHLRLHSGEKPFSCVLCSKSFVQKISLVSHVRNSHTREIRYTCDYCQKGFSDQSSWIVHVRTHTGSRPYKCEECGSGFITKQNLVRHSRIHTNDRPHKCDICERSYTRKYDLTRHFKAHQK